MVLFFRTPAAWRLAVLAFFAAVLSLAAVPMRALAQPGFADSKFAAVVMDADTGKILYARNPDSRRYPASLTKVMTLYMAFDALQRGKLKLTDEVVISRHAARQAPTKLGLRPGQSLTVKEALDVIAVKSTNDVAAALAEKIGGSEENFARMMTEKARQLGAVDTRFYNASGLPDSRHVTTARDLAVIARATVRQHPQYYRVFGQKQTSFRGRVIPGHDRLLALQGVDGMKTGYTVASGFNLISSGVRADKRIIAVVLGGATSRTRDRFMEHLLLAGFQAVQAPERIQRATLERLIGEPSDEAASTIQLAQEDHIGALLEQGDADEDDAAAPEDRAAAATWSVQVGAFGSSERARARLEDLRRSLPEPFADAEARLIPAGAVVNARFSGFTADEAHAACAALKSAGDDCFAVRG